MSSEGFSPLQEKVTRDWLMRELSHEIISQTVPIAVAHSIKRDGPSGERLVLRALGHDSFVQLFQTKPRLYLDVIKHCSSASVDDRYQAVQHVLPLLTTHSNAEYLADTALQAVDTSYQSEYVALTALDLLERSFTQNERGGKYLVQAVGKLAKVLPWHHLGETEKVTLYWTPFFRHCPCVQLV